MHCHDVTFVWCLTVALYTLTQKISDFVLKIMSRSDLHNCKVEEVQT